MSITIVNEEIKMKNIAIVTLAVALENEKGYSRFRFLATVLSKYYNVDLITSSFQHWEKKQRDRAAVDAMNTPYRIMIADEPGYKKNVDFRRIYSHKVAVKNIIKILKNNHYDLIYCIIPDNNMAASVGGFAKSHGIKFIVDIEDLWPEAMEMISPFSKGLNKVLFGTFRKTAYKAYLAADAFVGTSDEYRDVPKNKYGILQKPAITVYVGVDLDDFDSGIREFSNQIEKKGDEFWITYAGNLGASYDIGTLIKAGQILYSREQKDIKVKILGGGPCEEEFKSIAMKKKCNVEFMGYTPYRKMAAYLSKSDILINSFVRKAPQSIVTKIGDYLAAGIPIINTLASPEFRKKVEHDGLGRNIIAEDPEKLAEMIFEMKNDKEELDKMGKKSRLICEAEFDRKVSYLKIKDLIDDLLGENL